MEDLKFKNSLLSNKLIIAAVPTIIAFLVFYITKYSIEGTLYGALIWYIGDAQLILPTATITSLILGVYVYVTLKGFLLGATKNYQLNNKKKLLSRELQIVALTTITIYSAFNLQSELLSASQYGTIGVEVLHDFTIVIPTVIISTVALSLLVFIIIIEFLYSLSADAGMRHSQAIQQLVSGAFVKPDNDEEVAETTVT